jgi:hypothetical protein
MATPLGTATQNEANMLIGGLLASGIGRIDTGHRVCATNIAVSTPHTFVVSNMRLKKGLCEGVLRLRATRAKQL